MKIFIKLLLFISLLPAMAKAQNYYDQQWQKVENNVKKGLFKSNLSIVLELQQHAEKENNTVELIRALRAEFTIENRTNNDEENNYASRFFQKLKTVEGKLSGQQKLVFEVLKNSFISDYFDENRWKLQDRTNIVSEDSATIETWSRLDFKNYLSKAFERFNQQDLQAISLKPYKALFENAEDFGYFPTLKDWLATQEIKFLQNSDLFTPNEIAENNKTIVAIHDSEIAANQDNPKLYFQYQKLNFENNTQNWPEEKYREELQKIIASDEHDDYKLFLLNELAKSFLPKDPKQALFIIRQSAGLFPKSPFQNNLKNTESGILQSEITVNYENYIVPNQPALLSVTYKNATGFKLKIYRVTNIPAFVESQRNSYQNSLSKLPKQFVREDSFSLKDPNDYQSHTSYVELKSLPAGLYLAQYEVSGSDQRWLWFSANDAEIIPVNKQTGQNVYKLIDRETGVPIQNEDLNIYDYSYYNSKTKLIPTKTTGTGDFSLPYTKTGYYQRFVIQNGKSVLVFESSQRNSSSSAPAKDEIRTTILLDRAIYRPGQTVYFKVINLIGNSNQQKVASGLQQEIWLRDANNEVVEKQTFTTNDFGSYWGSFVLPKGSLNGTFKLLTEKGDGYKRFRVEEYKRPNFEITFDPVKTEYRLGDSLTIKGKALSFAGIPLANATVNYEIKKQDIRRRFFLWYPENNNVNSVLGTVKTNDRGEFEIPVALEKDPSQEGVQVFQYSINTEITDTNGETHDNSTTLTASSVSHFIEASKITNGFTGQPLTLDVATKNFDGANLHKDYHVELVELETPDRVFRDNFKEAIQDLPLMSKDEFVKKFPHDFYDKSELPENWKTKSVVEQKITKEDSLDLGKLKAGYYKLLLYNFEGKDTIRNEQFFTVWNPKKLNESQKPFLQVQPNKTIYQKGEKAQIQIYSAIPDATVYLYVQNGDGKVKFEKRKIHDGFLNYEVQIPQNPIDHRVNVQVQLAAFNDVKSISLNLTVMDNSTPMKLELTTFRDKIQPGSKEKWSLKVIGKNKEKTAAEVLADMYDQSLDQFASNSFSLRSLLQQDFLMQNYAENKEGLSREYFSSQIRYLVQKGIRTPSLEWFSRRILLGRMSYDTLGGGPAIQEVILAKRASPQADKTMRVKQSLYSPPPPAPSPSIGHNVEAPQAQGIVKDEIAVPAGDLAIEKDLSNIQVRKNLNETAFFYPNLRTDENGNVSFEFTAPEALTRWKLLMLAHDKQGNSATLTQSVVTQKDFSVTPNYPRFLRDGDEIVLQTKISSLVDKELNGKVQLQVLDAMTNQDISDQFGIQNMILDFNLQPNSQTTASWRIKTPKNISAIILKFVAKAGQYSDGEQKDVPVLTNRILVTDAVPIFVKQGQTKTFTLDNLKDNTSKTLENFSNTLQLNTNPIWEVIFALPSIKDDPNSSADVLFDKWFADVLASEIFKANPQIKKIFDEYQTKGLLKSKLEQNQELKQVLLQETPWVLEAQNETEQMEKIARLFDANNMRFSIQQDWQKLLQLQNGDGGFGWMPGSRSSLLTSLYILKNLGKLNQWLAKTGDLKDCQNSDQQKMTTKLIEYLDRTIDNFWTSKSLPEVLKNPYSNLVLNYLDSRHYWEKETPLKNVGLQLKNSVKNNTSKAKLADFTFYGLSRMALLLNDYGLKPESQKILTYLKETSTETGNQGTYWKSNLDDWGWYSSKVANQAMTIEAFQALQPNDPIIEEAKIWLITQKQVNHWSTSRATAEVIYTILNSGQSWTTANANNATIVWGGQTIHPSATGFVKETRRSDNLDKALGSVTITKSGAGIVQGGLYWQYYEDLNQVKSSESYLSITKELYRKVKTTNGEELEKITLQTPLKIGDRVTVRMILNTDRPMEYIHLKDMRAAGFEPVDVLSGYQWKNNLGYYQEAKDASTNFYIEQMPKGRYVFEYDVIANAAGTFSNGITTLQNYYAPEMNARTKGSMVVIRDEVTK